MNLAFQDAQRGPKKRGSKKTGLQSQFLEFVPRAEAAGRGKEEKTGGKSPAQKRRGVAGKRKQAKKPRAGAAGRGREEETGRKSPARLHAHFSTLTFIIE